MASGRKTPIGLKRKVALAKVQGKTWAEIKAETGISHANLSRILLEDDTQRFMAELRANSAEKLHEIHHLVLDSLIRDLKACTDPRESTRLRKHAAQVLTGQASARGGDRRQQDGPLVSIDNRQQDPQRGINTLSELLMAIRQPKEEVN